MISEEDVGELRPIGYYLVGAKSLFELITLYDVEKVGAAVEAFREANKLDIWTDARDALKILPASLLEKYGGASPKFKGITLRMMRTVNTAGIHCKERFVTANQVKQNI